jgi:uncharacterized metal-binding protein YceD (DUF177 family)
MPRSPRPEFSRPVHADRVGPEGRVERIEAGEAERAALARRYGIPAVGSLSAEVTLRPEPGGAVRATGHLSAEVTQSCVVTLDPVEQRVEEPVDLRFLPSGADPVDDPEGPDEIPMRGGVLDLGEAVAEQVALALDLYPRAEGAELPAEGAGADRPASPFAALEALRRSRGNG